MGWFVGRQAGWLIEVLAGRVGKYVVGAWVDVRGFVKGAWYM